MSPSSTGIVATVQPRRKTNDMGGRIPVVWLGLLAAGLALTVAGAFSLDQHVRSFVEQNATSDQKELASLISRYSEGHWLLAAGAIGWLFVVLEKNLPKQRRWIVVLVATIISGIIVNVPRSLTGRARPNNPVEQGWFGPRHQGQWLIGQSRYNSFPSGHTTTAMGFAVAILLCFRRNGWLAVAGALAVGWARIWVSAHHFSDVVVGILLGGFLGWAAWRWFVNIGWLGDGRGKDDRMFQPSLTIST